MNLFTVAPDGDGQFCRLINAARVLRRKANHRLAANHGKVGCALNPNAAIRFVLIAGKNQMERALRCREGVHRRHVMDQPITNEDGARQPTGRNVSHGDCERPKQPCAVALCVFSNSEGSHFKIWLRTQLSTQFAQCLFRALGACTQPLARTIIDHDHSDIAQRRALLTDKAWVSNGDDQRQNGNCPKRRSFRPAPHAVGQQDHRHAKNCNKDPTRH